MTQTLEVVDKDFKANFINMFKDLKETMIITNFKMDNLRWAIEFLKNNQIPELKRISEMKILLDRLDSRLEIMKKG